MPHEVSFVLEAEQGFGEAVIRQLAAEALPIEDVIRLPHFSDFMGRDIYLLYGDVPLERLYVPHVIVAEGGVDLLYNSFQLPFLDVGPPLKPEHLAALLMQRVPMRLRQALDPTWLAKRAEMLAALNRATPAQLEENLPFGVEGLTLGTLSDAGEFKARGDLEAILDTIQAKDAWRYNQGEDAVVAIIDSGVASSVIPEEYRAGGWTNIPDDDPWSDEYGHGSMVAAIAHAVAPEAKIFSLKPAPTPKGVMSSSGIYQAVDALLGWVFESGAKNVVTNNSWGVYGCVSVFLPGDVLGTRLSRELDRQKTSMVTWAAGNYRHTCGDNAVSVYTLASMEAVMSAGAVGRDLRPQFYTARGPGALYPWHPSCVAPTFGVLPWGDGYRDFGDQGGATSSCAPQVAGALAILMTEFPQALHRLLRAAIRASANNAKVGVGPIMYHPFTGSGLLQIADAVKAVPRAGLHPSYALEELPW